MYLANPSTPAVRRAMSDGTIGCLATPAQGNRIDPAWTWAADNGCFSEVWSAGRWITFLERNRDLADRCLFAVVPDAVADATETDRRFRIWAPVVRELGYKVAYVLQDGATAVPWDEIDALFIGGSTDYKLSGEAFRYAVEAQKRGRWVHWGRVNSRRRFAACCLAGDSADGTYLAFGPDANLPKLTAWLNHLPWGATA